MILPRNDCERVKKAFHFHLGICLTVYPDENTMLEISGSVFTKSGGEMSKGKKKSGLSPQVWVAIITTLGVIIVALFAFPPFQGFFGSYAS